MLDRLASIVLLAVLAIGCGRASGPAEEPLLFFCGSGLRPAADDLVRTFAERTGIRIEPTYTGSNCMLAQAEVGGAGDLFMPGELFYLEQAADRGLVREGLDLAIPAGRPGPAVGSGARRVTRGSCDPTPTSHPPAYRRSP